jgi:hypothetical protein
MTVFQTRNWLLFSAALIAASIASSVSASVHTTYDVLQNFSADGFSASWLYGATGTPNGSADNGALLSGPTTSRISGTLVGDLTGNVLSNVSGSVSGRLKELAGYLNSTLGTNFSTYTPFQLLLGGTSNGGYGAFKFETNGAGTGEFTGGYLDFSLLVGGSTASVLDGTFFFKPQAESGSDALSPNRGTSYNFSLWGWDWMHDGAPVDGATAPDWNSFLSSLGYTGDPVYRTPPDGSAALLAPLGVAMYLVDPPASTPEPTAIVIWGLLAMVATTFSRRQRATHE